MFNNANPIVPPMQDRTRGTYAETRAELEARKHAQMATNLALTNQPAPKKLPILAIVTIVLGVLALSAGGIAVYEYMEVGKLQAQLSSAETANASISNTVDTLKKQINSLTREIEDLRAQLTPTEESKEEPEDDPEEDPDKDTKEGDEDGGSEGSTEGDDSGEKSEKESEEEKKTTKK